MIKFSQLTANIPYPPNIKGQLSTLHAGIVTYVLDHYVNTAKYKTQVVSVLNTLAYNIITGSTILPSQDPSNPLTIELVDDDLCLDTIGNLYLYVRDILWDVSESEIIIESSDSVNKLTATVSKPVNSYSPTAATITPTSKEQLYIKAPTIPQFDTSKPWAQKLCNNTWYTIYRSLPLIPTNQSQISATTDITEMTSSDLMRLYPNCLIHTRAACMYEKVEGITLDPDVGLLLPIEGFTENQIRDNIIKYPHIYKLQRYLHNNYVSFYSFIEIENELFSTLDVWDSLPISKKMPKSSEFIKEYVARRYLLERDVSHIEHQYRLYGSLDPFLTLFTTPADYIRFGYTDTLDIAKQCVKSRVQYKRTRNPIIKAVCLYE